MKKGFWSKAIISVTVAAGLITGAQSAQAQQANWTGLNIGVHGGYAGTAFSGVFDNLGANHPWSANDADGGAFGAQIGYHVQFGQFVLGVEADASGMVGSESVIDGEADLQSADIDYLASVRLNIGFAFSNALLYFTGGAGFTEAEAVYENGLGSVSNQATGYVLGGGLKLAFSDTVSLGVEYLHYEFDETVAIPAGFADADAGDSFTIDAVDVVRLSLNFRLGRTEAPIVEEPFK